jgi:hypothetical protein
MPIQVDGALLRAPCPVQSCPACEPNTGSVHPNLPAKAARVEASRHCYAIKWVLEGGWSRLWPSIFRVPHPRVAKGGDFPAVPAIFLSAGVPHLYFFYTFAHSRFTPKMLLLASRVRRAPLYPSTPPR